MNQATIDALNRALTYDAHTGDLRWRERRGSRAPRGAVAGGLSAAGYWYVRVDGVMRPAHRVVWALAHGTAPTGDIDHINGVRSDNRLANLRDVTHAENGQNRSTPHPTNVSGFIGVTWRPERPEHRAWEARIYLRGQCKFLGRFPTAEMAHDVYVAAKRELHPCGTL